MLEPRVCGLPFPGLQYQYCIFANGLPCPINVGQITHDGSGAHFPDNGGPAGSSGSEYSLASSAPLYGAAEALETSLRYHRMNRLGYVQGQKRTTQVARISSP